MPAINQYPQLKAADGSDNVNFTQAGSNVVTRTVQDKLQDFVSPFVNDRYLINITYYL